MTIDGVSDAAQFEITKVKIMSFETVFLIYAQHAMKTIGIAEDKQQQIFQYAVYPTIFVFLFIYVEFWPLFCILEILASSLSKITMP